METQKFSRAPWFTALSRVGFRKRWVKITLVLLSISFLAFATGLAIFKLKRYYKSWDGSDLNINQIAWTNFINTSDVRDLILDGDILWLGTLGGVVKYDLKEEKVLATYSMADGLTSTTVYSLAKDGDVIWIGANGGVTSFNTRTEEWRSFTVEDGLVNGANITLALDGDYLWVGTFDGVSRYDMKNNAWKNFKSELLASAVSWNVSKIVVDPDAVWVLLISSSENSGGVARFDKAAESWQSFGPGSLGEADRVDPLDLVSSSEKSWANDNYNEAIYEFNKSSQTWRELTELFQELKDFTGQKDYLTVRLLGYEDPNLIIQSNNNLLLLYDVKTGAVSKLSDFSASTGKDRFYSTRFLGRVGSDFWFSSDSASEDLIYRFNMGSGSWESRIIKQPHPREFEELLSPLEDRLILSTSRGVEIFDPATLEYELLFEDLGWSYIPGEGGAVYDPVGKKVWLLQSFATEMGPYEKAKFWLYDSAAKKLTEVKLPVEIYGGSLVGFPEQDQIWFLEGGRTARYTISTGAIEVFDVAAYDLVLDSTGSVWVVTDEGLGKLEDGEVEYVSREEGGFHEIEFGDQKIWFGRGSQLRSYDPATGNLSTYDFPYGPPEYVPFPDWDVSPGVSDLKFGNGNLWVATSRGLSVYDGSEWYLYTSKEGLLGDNAIQVMLVAGKPWVLFTWGGLSGAVSR